MHVPFSSGLMAGDSTPDPHETCSLEVQVSPNCSVADGLRARQQSHHDFDEHSPTVIALKGRRKGALAETGDVGSEAYTWHLSSHSHDVRLFHGRVCNDVFGESS